MRRLWITRHKAAAACMAKMKVYIEDENGDTEIGGCLCRKLGELKNDQKKHFAIGTDAARVFVVADKLSRNLYNEFVEIPEGEDDVFLSGRNYLKPSQGNPFRFDGGQGEEVLENRAQAGRRGRGILIGAIIVGILAGAVIGVTATNAMLEDIPRTEAPSTFACRELSITLTEEFAQTGADGYTGCFSCGDTAVFLLREGFDSAEGFGELSLEDYGALVLAANGKHNGVVEQKDGLTTVSLVNRDSVTGTEYFYYCGLFKGTDAFWMVQITTEAEGASEEITRFRQWLNSVEFSE